MKKNHILSASFSALAAFAVMSAAAQTVTNPGFEANSLSGDGYGAISGWSNNVAASGVNNISQPFLEQPAHSGTQVAFIQQGAGGDPANPSALASKAPMANTVPLLATGTLGAGGEGQVHLVPQPAAGSGTLAWWVGGENQKARLPAHYEPADTAAGWSTPISPPSGPAWAGVAQRRLHQWLFQGPPVESKLLAASP